MTGLYQLTRGFSDINRARDRHRNAPSAAQITGWDGGGGSSSLIDSATGRRVHLPPGPRIIRGAKLDAPPWSAASLAVHATLQRRCFTRATVVCACSGQLQLLGFRWGVCYWGIGERWDFGGCGGDDFERWTAWILVLVILVVHHGCSFMW